jgi:hypothetical protein
MRQVFVILALAPAIVVPRVSIGAAPDLWADSNLASIHIEGATVFYDRAFEEEMPIFERTYRAYLEKQNETGLPEERWAAVIADVDETLGLEEPHVEEQEGAIRFFTGAWEQPPRETYLVDLQRVKEYLRRGGKLPGLNYDAKTDLASFTFASATAGAYADRLQPSLIIPLSREEDFREQTEEFFRGLSSAAGERCKVAIHEVVEMTFQMRCPPRDSVGRWFSDGIAEVFAAKILRRQLGDDVVDEYLSYRSPERFAGMKRESNLRYWMFENFRVKAPIEREQKLHVARYAFATAEVQRLVENCGIECIRQIIDELAEKKRWSERDLFTAIREVTGENMGERLLEYQKFSTREEGFAGNVRRSNRLMREGEMEGALFSALRLLELYESQLDPRALRTRRSVSLLLDRMGHEEAADAAMMQCMQIFDRARNPNAGPAAQEAFLTYCVDTGHPEKGVAVARELLVDRPGHVISLSVLMLAAEKEGETAEAQEYAAKIRAIDPDPSSPGLREANRIQSATAEIAPARD